MRVNWVSKAAMQLAISPSATLRPSINRRRLGLLGRLRNPSPQFVRKTGVRVRLQSALERYHRHQYCQYCVGLPSPRVGSNPAANATSAGFTTTAARRYKDAFRRLPSHGGPRRSQLREIAFKQATATLQKKAASSCNTGIAAPHSANTWAGNAAA